MLRIVPSQIVKLIETAFPPRAGNRDLVLRVDHSADIASVLAALAALPENHYSGLDGDARFRMLVAQRHMEDFVLRCRSGDATTQASLHLVGVLALGEVHPLTVVHDILMKCPDEPVRPVTVGELAFLGKPDLQAVLAQDIHTVESTLANGEYKAACVMAGSVIEALLLWAVKKKTRAEQEAAHRAWLSDTCWTAWKPPTLPSNCSDWKLVAIIEIARRMGLLKDPTANVAQSARDFRNLIHPARGDKTSPTLGAAQITSGAMVKVREELEALVASGQLV